MSEHHAETHHVVPVRIYLAIFFSLMVLTALTVVVARYDLGPLNTVAALTIAGIKATLVILYFMHVKYGHRLIWVFIGASLFWLALLITLTTSDYISRGW